MFFFQAEDGIRYLVRSRGLGDVYKRQVKTELMPDFDFDAFNHDENPDEYNQNGAEVSQEAAPVVESAGDVVSETPVAETNTSPDTSGEEVDKW